MAALALLPSACGGKQESTPSGPVVATGGVATGGSSRASGGSAAGGVATGATGAAGDAATSSIGYRCRNTETRIPRGQVCDGIEDCPDGDDEPCRKPVPACPAQAEVVATWLNGLNVCSVRAVGHQQDHDFSYAFPCDADSAIQPSRVCDGIIDCPAGNDEEGCPIACERTCTSIGTNISCGGPPCEFFCADGSTILQEEVCDGAFSCPGGEDEVCVDHFTCSRDPRRSRIEFRQLCDGQADCPDGEDEATCPPRSQFFICNDGNEILFPYFTSGCYGDFQPREPRCADHSAPYLPCPPNR